MVTEGTEVCDGDAGPPRGGEEREGPSPPGVCERPALREAPIAGRGENRVMAERKYPEGSGHRVKMTVGASSQGQIRGGTL